MSAQRRIGGSGHGDSDPAAAAIFERACETGAGLRLKGARNER
jgi:hypothetical protein